MLNYEIKALDNELYNPNFDDESHPDYQKKGYNVWSEHAVKALPGKFKDKETALKYKATRCIPRMINIHESQFGEIYSSKKEELDVLIVQRKTVGADAIDQIQQKHSELEAKQAALNPLVHQYKEKILLKKIAKAAKNDEDFATLSSELEVVEASISKLEGEIAVLETSYIDYKNQKTLEITNLETQAAQKSRELAEEKVNTCTAHVDYKNRAQREAAMEAGNV